MKTMNNKTKNLKIEDLWILLFNKVEKIKKIKTLQNCDIDKLAKYKLNYLNAIFDKINIIVHIILN